MNENQTKPKPFDKNSQTITVNKLDNIFKETLHITKFLATV